MTGKGKILADDKTHCRATHQRWVTQEMNRDMDLPDYKNEWYAEQCLMCKFYVRLTGKLIDDWGVCSNPQSPFDRSVMFEHDGCDYFSAADDEDWGFTDADVGNESQS